MRGFRNCALILALIFAIPGAGIAATATDELGVTKLAAQSAALLRVLRHRAPLSMVAADGAVGQNRSRYAHAAVQRDVIWLVLRGLTEANPDALDRSINALEYGFARQTAAGNFANGLNVSAELAVGADAFFLQAYCRIQLLISASQYAQRYRADFSAMNAQLPIALDWLKKNRNELYRQDRKATNRLFFDALAFGLCGKIASDREAILEGKQFLEYGVANQRSDGSFDEHGGSDSSYQAVSLLNIAGVLTNFSDIPDWDRLFRVFLDGAEWQLTRIEPSGRVISEGNARTGVGSEGDKEINYYEVMLALLYIGHLTGDRRYTVAAEDVARYIATALE